MNPARDTPTVPSGALRRAAALAGAHPGPGGYAVAYGSHASGHGRPTSDLDLLFVHDRPATPCAELVTAVIALHPGEGLTLDTEVRHDVKLCASFDDIDQATALAGFGAPHLRVTPVTDDPEELNAAPFRLRLFLSALSGPHMFLAGDLTAYRRHTAAADRATAQLALALLGCPTAAPTVTEAAGCLLTGPGGHRGKDWLGWEEGPALYATLHRGLAALNGSGLLSGPDHEGRYRTRARPTAGHAATALTPRGAPTRPGPVPNPR
ncbi:nucleotidyltransferase domain-containing protein [Embleya sp. NPDC005575]|uniref:nucleotidyltransferase domain-containing protein n=1 Tax=Embleya sp. NPDC005575 TaxID=3156892 RepID=UPI0033AEF3D2